MPATTFARMKTIVYQSYRTTNVPHWIDRCMRSVRSWAQRVDFEYRFIDDRLFDYLPDWYRRAASTNILVLTNLARLLVARELLAAGYERTIWIDADILVFGEDAFRIDVSEQFAFVREVWMTTRSGATVKAHQVNNSISVFTLGNCFLEFGIWAHEQLVRDGTRVHSHGTTSRLLTALHQAAPMPLLDDVGLFSPPVMRDLLGGNGTLVAEYAAAHGAPIHAANLGASLSGTSFNGITLTPKDFDATIDLLESTRGRALNFAVRAA